MVTWQACHERADLHATCMGRMRVARIMHALHLLVTSFRCDKEV